MVKKSLKRTLKAIPLRDEPIFGCRYPDIPDRYKGIGRPIVVGRMNPEGSVNREWLLQSAPPNATHYVLGEDPSVKGFLVQYYSVRKKEQ